MDMDSEIKIEDRLQDYITTIQNTHYMLRSSSIILNGKSIFIADCWFYDFPDIRRYISSLHKPNIEYEEEFYNELGSRIYGLFHADLVMSKAAVTAKLNRTAVPTKCTIPIYGYCARCLLAMTENKRRICLDKAIESFYTHALKEG